MGSPVPGKPLNFFPGAVEGKEDSIGISLRSFVLPPGSGDDFPLGHPVSLRMPQGTLVEKLLEKIFAERRNQVGLVAINGRVAEGKIPLADGDRVDVFELLGGG